MIYNPNRTDDGSVVHLLIIWNKALEHKLSIIEDLNKSFQILEVVTVTWDADLFLKNYSVFYAHSQYQRNKEDYSRILRDKISICGNGPFTVVVFRDEQPKFDKRKTSNGTRVVNVNVFDKKTQYRLLVGGGHRIHASDDAWETNHDLTLLFGKNTADFLRSIRQKHKDYNGIQEELYCNNCLGVGGYKSIEELFYVLNNAIDYVILRNHEPIPNDYTVEGHGDIDFLVENKNYASYLTSARPAFKLESRVYHYIKIGDKEIPVDFRSVGDNYYDKIWELEILKNRVLSKNLFYVPSLLDQYFSLLYHAYIQKVAVKSDYYGKLSYYAGLNGLKYNKDIASAVSQLDEFLYEKGYEYVRPNDHSVIFNLTNLSYSKKYCNDGILIHESQYDEPYFCKTAVYEKHNVYVKKGTERIIANEYKYLSTLGEYDCFPKIISYTSDGNNAHLEISKIDGINSQVFFKHRKNIKYVKDFLKESVLVLSVLAKHKIAHRDVIPQNFIIGKDGSSIKVSLIDFGWATNVNRISQDRPKGLADGCAPRGDESDFQIFANGLSRLTIAYLPYVKKIKTYLNLFHGSVTDSPDFLDVEIDKLLVLIERETLFDRFFFLLHYCGLYRVMAKIKSIRNYSKQII